MIDFFHSTKGIARSQIENLITVQEEFRPREGCSLPGLSNCIAYPKSYGFGGGTLSLAVELTVSYKFLAK